MRDRPVRAESGESVGVGSVERFPQQFARDASDCGGQCAAFHSHQALNLNQQPLGALPGLVRVGLEHFALDTVQTAALLQDMRELVRNEAAALVGAGAILAGAEYQMLADGKGACIGLLGKLGGPWAGVDADLAEAASETTLHEMAQRAIHRLPAGGLEGPKGGFKRSSNTRTAPASGLGLRFLFFLLSLQREGLRFLFFLPL